MRGDNQICRARIVDAAQATQLHVQGGSWGVEDHVPSWVKVYLELGAAKQGQFIDELSTRQTQRTNQAIMEATEDDVEVLVSSNVFRAFEADLRLLGDSAFQKRASGEEPQT